MELLPLHQAKKDPKSLVWGAKDSRCGIPLLQLCMSPGIPGCEMKAWQAVGDVIHIVESPSASAAGGI